MTELESYFGDDIHVSWNKCCTVWSAEGRVQDYPHGMRRPWYNPSLGKRLGLEFAARYFNETQFFVNKISSADEFERVCTFDLALIIAEPETAIIHSKTRASPASRASHCYPAFFDSIKVSKLG